MFKNIQSDSEEVNKLCDALADAWRMAARHGCPVTAAFTLDGFTIVVGREAAPTVGLKGMLRGDERGEQLAAHAVSLAFALAAGITVEELQVAREQGIIAAIKMVRERTDMPLRAAKDLVDKHVPPAWKRAYAARAATQPAACTGPYPDVDGTYADCGDHACPRHASGVSS